MTPTLTRQVGPPRHRGARRLALVLVPWLGLVAVGVGAANACRRASTITTADVLTYLRAERGSR